MSDDANKPLPPDKPDRPEVLGSGKEERPPAKGEDTAQRKRGRSKGEPLDHPDFERLRLTLDETCHDLQQNFEHILSHPRLARETVEYIAQQIVPHAPVGRPCKRDVTEAVRLRAEGQPWRVIYMRLMKRTRNQQDALRAAVRLRKYRSKRKEGAGETRP